MNYQIALVQLPLICEATKTRIETPGDVAEICADLCNLAQESFHVLLLNAQHWVINRQMVSLGVLNFTLAHPREIFRPAVLENAATIIVVHNHPSGDPTPSPVDIKLTNQLIKAGRVMCIRLMDHVIIGRETESHKGYFSLKANGICNFDANAPEPSNGKTTGEEKTAKEDV